MPSFNLFTTINKHYFVVSYRKHCMAVVKVSDASPFNYLPVPYCISPLELATNLHKV